MGKTHLAAVLAVEWAMTHPLHETSVVVLAPTHNQVKEGGLQAPFGYARTRADSW